MSNEIRNKTYLSFYDMFIVILAFMKNTKQYF